MSKVMIAAHVTRLLTSPGLRSARRRLQAVRRRLSGKPAELLFFYEPGDPYSHLAAQCLARITARYDLRLRSLLVPPPPDAAAPDRARLLAWGVRDAKLIAGAHGLAFPDQAVLQDPTRVSAFAAMLAQALPSGDFPAICVTSGDLFWHGAALPAPSGDATAALAEGGALRARLGHYLGATFYFEGEWYWGVDRLHHLHSRLALAGLDRTPGAPAPFPCPEVTLAGKARTDDATSPPGTPSDTGSAPRRELHYFPSLRSPYTYIATPRVLALARHYNADLKIRFVLPMVMRGLAVPQDKRLYIALDTKREAERLGLPFGFIADPVGAGAERGLAVLHHAIAAGRGPEFLLCFLRAVFAEGIDAATDAGLAEIARRAGVSPALVQAALHDQSWREVAEANRQEMLGMGLWGVPSFRVDDKPGVAKPGVWGQDRLFLIERDLQG